VTTARVTQTAIEVVRQEDQPAARVTQTAIEVVRQEDQVKARVSQCAIELIRRNYPEGIPATFALLVPAGM
jgi:hypothetical protein